MKIKTNQLLAASLTRQQADLLSNWVFNNWQLKCYKITGDKFMDTDYLYNVYLDNRKTITNAQQMFIQGIITGIHLVT